MEAHGAIAACKEQAIVKGFNNQNGYFEMYTGRRFTINAGHCSELIEAWKDVCIGDWNGALERDVKLNSALYLSKSQIVCSLLSKPFEQQKKALNTLLYMAKNGGKGVIELTASEWLMFTRACEHHLLGAISVLVNDGVDMHAQEILNSIDGTEIQGVKSIVTENDVPYLQRKETDTGVVWSYSVRNM